METSLFTCQYCGKDTSEVEYDYLVGVDHLSCALQQEQNQKNPIEKCVICGVDTQYRFRTPIDFRYNYVEGAENEIDKRYGLTTSSSICVFY